MRAMIQPVTVTSPGSGLNHPVAEAANGFDAIGAVAKLLTKPPDVGVHRTRIDDTLVTPHVIQQRIAALNAPPAFHQYGEQFKLCCSEVDRLTLHDDLITGTIDLNIAEPQHIGSLLW